MKARSMKIHKVRSPYDKNEEFYVKLPDEFPVEKEVECAKTGKDILLEYEESDEEDVRFVIEVSKLEEEENDEDSSS